MAFIGKVVLNVVGNIIAELILKYRPQPPRLNPQLWLALWVRKLHPLVFTGSVSLACFALNYMKTLASRRYGEAIEAELTEKKETSKNNDDEDATDFHP